MKEGGGREGERWRWRKEGWMISTHIKVGEVVVPLGWFQPRPCNIQPHNVEPILHQKLDVFRPK